MKKRGLVAGFILANLVALPLVKNLFDFCNLAAHEQLGDGWLFVMIVFPLYGPVFAAAVGFVVAEFIFLSRYLWRTLIRKKPSRLIFKVTATLLWTGAVALGVLGIVVLAYHAPVPPKVTLTQQEAIGLIQSCDVSSFYKLGDGTMRVDYHPSPTSEVGRRSQADPEYYDITSSSHFAAMVAAADQTPPRCYISHDSQ